MRLKLAPAALLGLLAACAETGNVEVFEAPVGGGGTSSDATAAADGTAADPNEAAPAASEPVPMPAGLNSEERFIWSTLTPEAQRQAAEFIANGGTLLQFINA